MTPCEVATARGNAYGLLSDLFLNGVTAVNHPILQQTELGIHLPDEPDFEALGAIHYDILGLNVLPYESAFLAEDGMLGGEVATAVGQSMERLGVPLETAVSEPDHIGWELHTLSFLCGAEADAWEDGNEREALRMQHQQQRFLESHLLRWAAPFAIAIVNQENKFYATCADLLWDLLTTHYKISETPISNLLQLPTPPDVLSDEKAGLREIVRLLIRPSLSGWLLTRHDITQLSRQFELPHGFGSREQMVLNLMRSAVQYEQLNTLLEQLNHLTEEWQAAYQERMQGEVTPFVEMWIGQNGRTQTLLHNISLSTTDIQTSD